jgi:hypothetical protein
MMAWTVARHFEKRPANVRATYDAIVKAARALGPMVEDPKKTSIHLNRRTAFAGVSMRRASLILTVKSPTAVDNARVRKALHASARRWYLEIELVSPRDIDRELRDWLKQSYELSA